MALTSKAELLEAIRIQRGNIERVVEQAADRMEQPGAAEDWTLKDVIAHLTGWRQRSVARLEAAVNDGPVVLPWELPGNDEDDFEPINQHMYETNRDRPLADVLMDSRASFDRLATAVEALDEDALFTSGRYEWMDGEVLGPAIIGGTVEHFHEEHEADINAFLNGS